MNLLEGDTDWKSKSQHLPHIFSVEKVDELFWKYIFVRFLKHVIHDAILFGLVNDECNHRLVELPV